MARHLGNAISENLAKPNSYILLKRFIFDLLSIRKRKEVDLTKIGGSKDCLLV